MSITACFNGHLVGIGFSDFSGRYLKNAMLMKLVAMAIFISSSKLKSEAKALK